MWKQLHPRILLVKRWFGVKIGLFQSNVYVFFRKFHSIQVFKEKRACELYHNFLDKW